MRALFPSAWLTGQPDPSALDRLGRAMEAANATGNLWAQEELAFWSRRLGLPTATPQRGRTPYARMDGPLWREAAASWATLQAPYERALAMLHEDKEAQQAGLLAPDDLGSLARGPTRESRAEGPWRAPHPSWPSPD